MEWATTTTMQLMEVWEEKSVDTTVKCNRAVSVEPEQKIRTVKNLRLPSSWTQSQEFIVVTRSPEVEMLLPKRGHSSFIQ